MKLSSIIDLSKHERPWDGWLLFAVCVLTGIGVVMVYSASAFTGLWTVNDEFFFFNRQLLYVLIGCGAMFFGLKFDYRWYQRLAYPLLILTILLLIAVAGAGTMVNNARRWIRLGGFNVQPAEIAKITMSFFLAYSMCKKQDKMRSFSVGFLPHVILVGLICLLLMLEPDLGSCILLVCLMGSMLLYAGNNILYSLGGIALAGLGGWLVIAHSHRINRIEAFLDPWSHARDSGYQITQSWISIGNGGIYGQGLGDGLGKLGFIPELHTDCIGTLIAEEFGFVGVAFVIAFFLLFTFRGFLISARARDNFGRLTAFGITLIISLQAAINLGVLVGLIPSKGFTLPFISYGGSSLIMTLFAVGVLLNISKGSEDKYAKVLEEKNRKKKEKHLQEKKQRYLQKRRQE